MGDLKITETFQPLKDIVSSLLNSKFRGEQLRKY